MQKRTYYIPTIEILTLHTERIMGLGDPSNVAEPPAPQRVERRDPAF